MGKSSFLKVACHEARVPCVLKKVICLYSDFNCDKPNEYILDSCERVNIQVSWLCPGVAKCCAAFAVSKQINCYIQSLLANRTSQISTVSYLNYSQWSVLLLLQCWSVWNRRKPQMFEMLGGLTKREKEMARVTSILDFQPYKPKCDQQPSLSSLTNSTHMKMD